VIADLSQALDAIGSRRSACIPSTFSAGGASQARES